MNRRYLDIDSTFRNRKCFKNPSNFEILFSESGCREGKDAYDPISFAAPIIEWSPSKIVNEYNITIVPHTSNNNSQFIVSVQDIKEKYYKRDYFVGYPLTLGCSGNNIIQTLVTSSQYINTHASNNSYFRFTIEPQVQDISSCQIIGPSGNITDIFSEEKGFIWVPCSMNYDNMYICDYYLWNDCSGQCAEILSYDGVTHQIGVDPAKISGWCTTDISCNLSIRKEKPLYAGPIEMEWQTGLLNCKPNSFIIKDNNIKCGDFIRICNGTNNTICKVISYSGNKGKVILQNNSEVNLCVEPSGNGTNDCKGDIGDYFLILPDTLYGPKDSTAWPVDSITLSDLTNIENIKQIILPYVVCLQCVDSEYQNIDIKDYIVDGAMYEILKFSRDNVVPLVYSGSMVSQQQMVCYEVELLDLILPNKILDCGNLPAFYPFFYVTLQNVSSAGAGLRNIIYSNNPNATRMLFKVPITDTSNPFISPFINLSSKMVQTIKFKPNDNLFFGVYLPNGNPFKLDIDDNMSPLCPNAMVQISATFSIKRL